MCLKKLRFTQLNFNIKWKKFWEVMFMSNLLFQVLNWFISFSFFTLFNLHLEKKYAQFYDLKFLNGSY